MNTTTCTTLGITSALVLLPVLAFAQSTVVSNNTTVSASSQSGNSHVEVSTTNVVNGTTNSYHYESDESSEISFTQTLTADGDAAPEIETSVATDTIGLVLGAQADNLDPETRAWLGGWLMYLLRYVELIAS